MIVLHHDNFLTRDTILKSIQFATKCHVLVIGVYDSNLHIEA